MKTSHRPFLFESDDFQRMCRFVIDDCQKHGTDYTWHIGRIIDWKYGLKLLDKHFPDNFSREAELWFDWFGELIGFVLAEDFRDDLALLVRSEWHCLVPEMAEFAKQQWGIRYESISIMLPDSRVEIAKALEDSGYVKKDNREVTYVFETACYGTYRLPDDAGTHVETMAQSGDYEAQNLLRGAAFDSGIQRELDRKWRAYLRRSPIYSSEFDFVLIDGDQRMVSGCEAFIDRYNATAEIERVCTHPDAWGKGYGRQILLSCLRVLSEAGIPTAFITGGYDKTIHLYGSLGHVDSHSRGFWEWRRV